MVLLHTVIDFILAAKYAEEHDSGVNLVVRQRNSLYRNHQRNCGVVRKGSPEGKSDIFALPIPLLSFLMKLAGKGQSFEQISGGLELDVDKAQQLMAAEKVLLTKS